MSLSRSGSPTRSSTPRASTGGAEPRPHSATSSAPATRRPRRPPRGRLPAGRWLSDQRRAYRAGAMSGERAAALEELGIVWDTADAYFALHRTLAAPPHASALDIPVGQ
ncbi:helicase associated domain-containing protein [Streptomyces sp. NPDC051555]|uniref:helicase associated domain-containing protein n=1 Tax=Streptomyces sp. NPDC051555 TaxID=3365657 RepID=UPI003787F851